MHSINSCRICLKADDGSDMELPFDEIFEESVLFNKIEICGGIKLELRDGLPKKICSKCVTSLNISYEFRDICQTNDLKLKQMLADEELEIKDEPHFEYVQELGTLEELLLSERSNHSADSDDASSSKEKKVKKKRVRQPTNKKKKEKAFPSRKVGRPRTKDSQICELCGNVYPTVYQLTMHRRRHDSEKPFSCEICQKKFANQQETNRHMRVHTGARPFKCKYCDRTFGDRSTNIKHERIHTNERPFKCETCGKSFTYSNVLKNHMLTHTGEKRFECDVCDKKFSRVCELKQHLATITHKQREAKLNFPIKQDESFSITQLTN
ncbi:transcription factor Ouib-like [Episyrphus balteatus]|uniref:transcription factor Ouib-like n=1 Tax=Episyrphus balteatus TaxID=286459 RepID=UPI00248641A1|nr:transcription factor Ouib-like [Episyrphus balteatus]